MLCLNCRHAVVRVVGFTEDGSPKYVITCVASNDCVEWDVYDCSHYDSFGNYFDENLYEFWRKR